jgi:hypothetical protein
MNMNKTTIRSWAKSALLTPARFFNSSFAYVGRLEMGFARGAVNIASRTVDPCRPQTWEFCALSQNGEDGIIDELLRHVASPNRFFVEIGASDGLENNSAYLAFAKKYDGLMIDGDAFKSLNAKRSLQALNWAIRYVHLFVTPDNVEAVIAEVPYRDPDFLSLDIDGNDYFVLKALLRRDFRPKVICVEFNSAFGPTAAISIAYTPGLDYKSFHASQLYYGVSVTGWRVLLESLGYVFVTVDSHGVNAFFADPSEVSLPDGLVPLEFAENATQARRNGGGWDVQFAKIQHLPYESIRG